MADDDRTTRMDPTRRYVDRDTRLMSTHPDYPERDDTAQTWSARPGPPAREPRPFDAARLWAGGAATALVAGLVAVVGILVARGLLDVAVLAPKGEGAWGNANTLTYALVSAGCALAATGLMQLLLATTPNATRFFGWIMVLLALIAVVLPLSLDVSLESRVFTAVLNFLIGLTITLLLRGLAATARHKRSTRPDPATQWRHR